MTESEINSQIKENFLKDRDVVVSGVRTYLSSVPNSVVAVDDCRESAKKNIAEGNLIAAMQNLEIARDARRGISSFIYSSEKGGSPLFIRDARKCVKTKEVFEEGIEAAETLVLCAFEAAKDVLQINQGSEREDEIKKMAIDFFANFEVNNANKTQKNLIKAVDTELNKITDFLTSCGIKNASKQLTKTLHFQNFKQQQNCNPVTISEITDDEENKHLVIDANVAFKEITVEQKRLYDKITKSSSIPDFQKKLMNKYREEFFSGRYIIPTQLIDLFPGVRNGFEEITMFAKNCEKDAKIAPEEVEIIDVRKRCGALSSLIKDDKLAHDVSESNVRQIDSLIGQKNGKKIHWNSLNTGSPSSLLPFNLDDFRIVKRSQNVVDGDNHKLSVTPFNAFRSIPNTGDFKGIKNYLEELMDSISSDSKDAKILSRGIKPKGFFSSLFSSKLSFDKAFSRMDDDCKNIISLMKDLQQDLKKLSKTFIFGLDKENIRLRISNKFNALSKAVNGAIENENSTFLKIFDIDKVPYEEVFVFCKSGKDRTGLSMFCQEIHKIQNKTKISFEKAANQLHLSGHIETLPGSIRIGGGTPGCYQLLESILPAIPQSQKEALQPLVGPFAAKNKMPKKTSFFSKLKKFFSFTKDENDDKDLKWGEKGLTEKNSYVDSKNNDFGNVIYEGMEEETVSSRKTVSNFTSSQLVQKSNELLR